MKQKKTILLVMAIFIITLSFSSCDTTNPPSPNKISNSITLKTEWQDLYRIEVNWNISENDKENNYIYKLIRSDQAGDESTIVFFISGNDTSYIDDNLGDSLEIGKQYNYKIKAYNASNELADTSNTLYTSTLSLTSHDIVWEIDTLGQAGDFLKDVWGIDENNVWAVGAIEMGKGLTSIIKWDGGKWNYHSYPGGHIVGIYGFDENNIWVVGDYANRAFIGHFDGTNWTEYKYNYFYERGDTVYNLNAVWGSSPEDVWAVGWNGTIIHWNGIEWIKHQSPVKEHLYDIWGSSPNNIYAVAYSILGNSKVIFYDGEKWSDITSMLPFRSNSLISIWIDKAGRGFAVGGDSYSFDEQEFNYIGFNDRRFQRRVRGNNITNIFICEKNGYVYHYNGSPFWEGWKRYNVLQSNENSELNGITVFEKNVFIVGSTKQNVIIIRGETK